MKIPGQIFLLSTWMLLLHNVASAQLEASCRAIGFSEPATGSATFMVDQVEGQAVFAPVAAMRELGGASGVCVVLFKRLGKMQVSFGVTDGGRFVLPRPTPGAYVLIACLGPLHEIVVPIQVSDTRLCPDGERGLLLHMRAKEDSQKSFVSLIRNLGLRRELIEMVRVDQDVRNELIRMGVTTPDPGLESRMATVDAKNTKRLQEIVAQYGWPGPDLVGMDGAEAAFLIVQHASYRVQKELWPLVETAYREGILSGQNYALLLDRILVQEGKAQVYGTHAKRFDQWKGDEPTMEPIEDEANVDRRRAEVGLMPLAEYRELLKQMYFPSR